MKKLILDIAKLIGAIVTIGGSALWFDSKFDASVEKQEDVLQMIEYVNTEQAMMAEDIMDIKDSVNELDMKVDAVVDQQHKHQDAINNIGWAVKNQDNFTPEQLREILDNVLKKNTEHDIVFIPIE